MGGESTTHEQGDAHRFKEILPHVVEVDLCGLRHAAVGTGLGAWKIKGSACRTPREQRHARESNCLHPRHSLKARKQTLIYVPEPIALVIKQTWIGIKKQQVLFIEPRFHSLQINQSA